MTDKEKKALLNAFGIPEPDRKEEFAEEFRQRMSQKEKKRISPIVMRIAATAAMLTILAGIYAIMPSSPSDLDVKDKLTDTTTTVVYDQESNDEPITTSCKNITTAPTSSAQNTIVTKTAANDKKTIVTNSGTASEQRPVVATKGTASGGRISVTATASRTEKLSSKTSATLTITHTTRRNPTTVKPTATIIKTTATTANHYPVTSREETSATPVNPVYRDMTVTPDVIYTINGKVVDARSFDTNSNSPVSDGPPKESDNAPKGAYTNFEQKIREMFNNSYAVVLAKIDKIVYTSINGTPFTAENISVQEVFKGDINYNDMITVYVNGGYMPATEYMESHGAIYIDDPENVTVYDSGGCNGTQEEGETYLFFISNNAPDIPYGAFSLSAYGDEAVFRKRRNNYISLSNERMSFSTDLFN